MPDDRSIPYPGEESFLFLSCAREDREMAMTLRRCLAEQNVRVWYGEGIDPGVGRDDGIEERIRACDGMIALISCSYLASDGCRRELNCARDHQKERLLIYLEPVALPDGMTLPLIGNSALFCGDYEDEKAFIADLLEMPMIVRNRPCPRVWPDVAFEDIRDASGEEETSWIRPGASMTLGGRTYRHVMQWQDGYASRIYRAADGETGEAVAIKQYIEEDAACMPVFSDDALRRDLMALRDGRLGVIRDVVAQEGAHCIIMDWVDGETLEEYLRRHRPDARETLSLMRDILQGLSVLHGQERPLTCTDVTWRNVMITDGRAVLIDFSEANYSGRVYPPSDMTVGYDWSPERMQHVMIDCRSDLYEAGMVLQHLNERACAACVRPIIQRATQAIPGDRYQTAAEMLEDINRLLGSPEPSNDDPL